MTLKNPRSFFLLPDLFKNCNRPKVIRILQAVLFVQWIAILQVVPLDCAIFIQTSELSETNTGDVLPFDVNQWLNGPDRRFFLGCACIPSESNIAAAI